MMSSFSDGGMQHPQSMGGQVAGVANNIQVRRTKPKFQNTAGTVRIVHKELVGTVVSNTAIGLSPQYTTGNSVYQVNAGCENAMPWLASIGNNFEFYKFNRLRLVYVPLCATTEIGRVMLGYDPDSTDSVPAERQALSSMACSSEASAWGVLSLDCKLSDTNKWYYSDTSTGNAATAYNDQGQFFWSAWSNKDSSTSLGELYVLYDVSLKDPQPNAFSVYQTTGTGATAVINPPGNAPFSITTGATSIKVNFFVPGDYEIRLKAAATATAGTLTFTGGATSLSTYNVTDATHVSNQVIVRVTGSFDSAQFTGLTALGNWEIYLTRVPRFSVYTFA
jgi:hypothetical protein